MTNDNAPLGEPLSEADRLAEIQARLDAATPGPWHRRGKSVLGPREESDLGSGPAALLHTGMPYDGPNGRCGANAELAANAPADLVFLLNLVGVLEGQLATAREDLDQFQRAENRRLEAALAKAKANPVAPSANEAQREHTTAPDSPMDEFEAADERSRLWE